MSFLQHAPQDKRPWRQRRYLLANPTPRTEGEWCVPVGVGLLVAGHVMPALILAGVIPLDGTSVVFTMVPSALLIAIGFQLAVVIGESLRVHAVVGLLALTVLALGLGGNPIAVGLLTCLYVPAAAMLYNRHRMPMSV